MPVFYPFIPDMVLIISSRKLYTYILYNHGGRGHWTVYYNDGAGTVITRYPIGWYKLEVFKVFNQ